MTSVDLIRAATVWPFWRRISRTASAVIIEVMRWPPMESVTCAIKPHGLDLRDAADELISSADFAEVGAPLAHVAGLGRAVEKLIDLLFRNAMVAAGGFDGANLSLVDPLFKRGIADAKDLSGFARRK